MTNRHGLVSRGPALLPPAAPTARWRVIDRVVAFAFVVVLLVPAGAMAAGLRPGAIENRPIRAFPSISLGSLFDTSWYGAVDGALTDRLALRPDAVRLRAELAFAMGGTGTTRVVRGQGDWLFYGLDFVLTCRVSASALVASLDSLKGQFDAHGQKLRVMVAPDKSSIYPDRLLAGLAPTGCTAQNREPVRAALADRTTFTVDAWQLLEAARRSMPGGLPLYYTQDTHWTPTGAAIAIHGLIDTFDPSLWDERRVVADGTYAAVMDLASIVGRAATESSVRILARPEMNVSRRQLPAAEAPNPLAVFELTTAGSDSVVGGRTLVIYDSFFGNVAADLVAPFLGDSIWITIDVLLAHPELGQRFGPFDTVILERVERGVYEVPLETILRPLVRTGG